MLKSTVLQNKKVATSFGEAEFNHLGESHNLPEEHQKSLAEKVPYLTHIPDKKEKPKEEKEVKEEKVKEEKPKAKKAPAKAKTAKKDKE